MFEKFDMLFEKFYPFIIDTVVPFSNKKYDEYFKCCSLIKKASAMNTKVKKFIKISFFSGKIGENQKIC